MYSPNTALLFLAAAAFARGFEAPTLYTGRDCKGHSLEATVNQCITPHGVNRFFSYYLPDRPDDDITVLYDFDYGDSCGGQPVVNRVPGCNNFDPYHGLRFFVPDDKL